MPGRKTPLITKEIYHIVNRGITSQPLFLNQKNYQRFLETIFYYQISRPPLRYSFFIRLPENQKNDFLERLRAQHQPLVEIIAYCLMPNHFHFLLKQIKNHGISIFMANLANSYTRYFNTKYRRKGPLFQGRFKAIRVEKDEQLLHVQRYIHLNPYSSHLVKNFKELENYPYSSLPEYLKPQRSSYCHKNLVMDNFKTGEAYKKFIFDQADYQRRLQDIKNLSLEG